MRRKLNFTEGDIILYGNNLVMIQDLTPIQACNTICIQPIDKNECAYIDPKNLADCTNLGKSPEVAIQFHIGHSIHIRLNKLSNV